MKLGRGYRFRQHGHGASPRRDCEHDYLHTHIARPPSPPTSSLASQVQLLHVLPLLRPRLQVCVLAPCSTAARSTAQGQQHRPRRYRAPPSQTAGRGRLAALLRPPPSQQAEAAKARVPASAGRRTRHKLAVGGVQGNRKQHLVVGPRDRVHGPQLALHQGAGAGPGPPATLR